MILNLSTGEVSDIGAYRAHCKKVWESLTAPLILPLDTSVWGSREDLREALSIRGESWYTKEVTTDILAIHEGCGNHTSVGVFCHILDLVEYNSFAYVTAKDFRNLNKSQVSRELSALEERGMIRKIKRGVYAVHPYFVWRGNYLSRGVELRKW